MDYDEIIQSALKEVEDSNSSEKLEQVRIKYFGKNGTFTNALKSLSTLSIEEKKSVGEKLNGFKNLFFSSFSRKKNQIENLEINKKFCLNLLKSSQIDLANLCSGEDDGEKRFSKGEWSQIEPVYLTNAQSNIFCTIDKIFPFHSHSLVVGKIYDLKHSGEKDPLIYQDGEYE